MEPYDDIIHLPHPVSSKHPRMTMENRAAQFSPFAALSGYDAAIVETARQTDKQIELAENAIVAIDRKLGLLADRIHMAPDIAVTYFLSDDSKEGGAYVTSVGTVKKIDGYDRVIVLVNGETIRMEDILHVECDLFNTLL
jgi:hypothetical protein